MQGDEITLLAFGPLAETLNWKRYELTVPHSTKVDAVLRILKLMNGKVRVFSSPSMAFGVVLRPNWTKGMN